jgi:hypothetical protein
MRVVSLPTRRSFRTGSQMVPLAKCSSGSYSLHKCCDELLIGRFRCNNVLYIISRFPLIALIILTSGLSSQGGPPRIKETLCLEHMTQSMEYSCEISVKWLSKWYLTRLLCPRLVCLRICYINQASSCICRCNTNRTAK